MGGRRGAADDRSEHRGSQERAADLLRLRAACLGLRPAAGATFRVRPAVGNRRVLRLRHAAGGVPGVWREGGASSLVRRETPTDHDVSLVPRRLGKAALLAAGRLGVRYELAKRLSLGKIRGFEGAGPSRLGRRRGHRRGRDPMATGAQVPDAGVPDRRGLPAAVVGGQRPHDQDASAILPHVWQETFGPAGPCSSATATERRPRPDKHWSHISTMRRSCGA